MVITCEPSRAGSPSTVKVWISGPGFSEGETGVTEPSTDGGGTPESPDSVSSPEELHAARINATMLSVATNMPLFRRVTISSTPFIRSHLVFDATPVRTFSDTGQCLALLVRPTWVGKHRAQVKVRPAAIGARQDVVHSRGRVGSGRVSGSRQGVNDLSSHIGRDDVASVRLIRSVRPR